ncbi:polysaccharide pyruvyl transferase family protein [Sediminicoccus rosea]|uniref:Polysaccharide pyruvyl transferase family protein n=1 Tax=Sediminicoccus rosea TaxID=1225128 RepID=A0ABZ0PMH2_9PROT|nr:polysaccharide pyruvyl transferase family protein [Sediminicoccus rosea]WPB86911.1 polysaccharide pyruvyl transferase family protein [Sediminicoccus rosea]
MASRPSVFLTGTFDVSNYGDLLFPLVAAARLAAAGVDVVPVAPTANQPAFSDAMAPVAAARMLGDASLAPCGVLVGGGYILMAQPASGMRSYEQAGVAREAYPSLWIGAALAAAIRDIPLVLNAPGAPFPFASGRRDDFAVPALRAADYLSVRDAQSARMFAPAALDWSIVPDTVLDLPRVWSAEELAGLHAGRLAHWGLPSGTPTLAIHVRARALGDPAELAARIDALALRHGLFPLLMILGSELGDRPTARRISAGMTCAHRIVDDAGSLRELAAHLASSVAYVGSSFHGYVTASAYGKPAVSVAIPAHGKYRGLLDQLSRPGDLARDWQEGFARAEAHLARPRPSLLPPGIGEALDRHWATITAALNDASAGRARRMDFLRSYLRGGARHLTAPWVVAPHLSRRQ